MRQSTLRKTHLASELYNDGTDIPDIAREFGTSERTIERFIRTGRELGIVTRPSVKGPPKHPLVHGSVHGYTSHKCRCGLCRAAWTESQRGYRQSRRARKDSANFAHGAYGYTNWGCRCEVCCDEHAKRMLQGRKSRRQRPEDTPHGTVNGYVGWSCRCEPCKMAAQDYRQARKAVHSTPVGAL